MRDHRVRVAFVGLILALPILMVLMNPKATSVREAALPILGVEGVLVGGLSTVARERKRLLAERTAVANAGRSVPSVPHVVLPTGRVTAGRS